MAHTYASLVARSDDDGEKEAARLKLQHKASIFLSSKKPRSSEESIKTQPEKSEDWLSGFDLGDSRPTHKVDPNQRKSSRKLKFKRKPRMPRVQRPNKPNSMIRKQMISPMLPEPPVADTEAKKSPDYPVMSTSAALTRTKVTSVGVDGLSRSGATAKLGAKLKNTGIVTSFSTNLGRGQRSASAGRLSRVVKKTPEQKRLEIEKKWPLAKQSRELFGDVMPSKLNTDDRIPRFVPSHGGADYKGSGCSAVASFLGFAK